MNMKFIPVLDLHWKFMQSAYFWLPKTSSNFDPLPVGQMLCFWSLATKVSSQILKCSTLLTHRVLLRTRTCAPPPQEVPTSSSCRRTTRPMLHCVTSLAEKVAMEVFRGFVKRNLVEKYHCVTSDSCNIFFQPVFLQVYNPPEITLNTHDTNVGCL